MNVKKKKKNSFVCEELLWPSNKHFSLYFLINFMQRSNGEAAAKNTGEVLENLRLSHSPENSQKNEEKK